MKRKFPNSTFPPLLPLKNISIKPKFSNVKAKQEKALN